MFVASVSQEEDDDAGNVVMAASVGDSEAEEENRQTHVRPVHMISFINFLHNAPIFF